MFQFFVALHFYDKLLLEFIQKRFLRLVCVVTNIKAPIVNRTQELACHPMILYRHATDLGLLLKLLNIQLFFARREL